MEHKFLLEQKQTQTLILSPQMQQALHLLQLPLLELEQFLQQELVQNPVLEEVEASELPSPEEEEPRESKEEDYQSDIEEEMERLARFDGEWKENLREFGDIPEKNPEDAKKQQFFESSITRNISLEEHLLNQFHLSVNSSLQEKIGRLIIGNIDENGYLQSSLEELSLSSGASPEETKEVLSVIQTLDPSGVGAENLKECLLIQLGQQEKENSLEAKIIKECLKDLERKKYPQIAKNLGVSLEKIIKAAEFISCLEPKPGRNFSPEKNYAIIPELMVKKINNEYQIISNDSTLPELRVNPLYRKLMQKGNSPAETRKYITEKFKSAIWIIKSIEQRKKTIRRVAECIVRKQKDFLDKGVEYLKPYTQGEIASEIGMHVSTVSRVTSNKYIDTPQGVLELKFFFAGETSTSGDDTSLSSKSTKEKLKNLIDAEDKKHPLSDAEITKQFEGEGINISRRTIAKYRESLKILPSNLRKKY